MTDPKTKISDKAQLATMHYIANFITNPIKGYTWSAAMRDAGFAETTIDKHPNYVSGLLGVQRQISAAIAKIKAKSVATRLQRQEFWTDVQSGKLINDDGTTVNVDITARLRASELLGRSEADFTDNVNDNREGLTISVTAPQQPKLSPNKAVEGA
jgi:hypothetical protein